MANSPMRRPRAPLVPTYRMEVTRRATVGLTLSSIIAALLIFLSGVTIGVRLQFAAPGPEANPAGGASGRGVGTIESSVPALAGSGQAFRPASGGGAAGENDRARSEPTAATHMLPQPTHVPPADQVSGDDTFVLQFGAFRVRENAERLLEQLITRGYAAEIRKTTGAGTAPLYRVVAGRFASPAVAGAAAERVRLEIGDEVYVMSDRELGG